MSRIGRQPVVVPEKVEIKLAEGTISVKGPKGSLDYTYNPGVTVAQEDKTIVVKPVTESKFDRALWGLTRTLVNNMVIGVTDGFTKKLIFNGVGYKAVVKGKTIVLNLGYSHPINYDLPEGIEVKVVKNEIAVSGISKELVGFAAAKIRSFREPEPYKGKGVRYADEVIIRKAGKTGGKK
jgi:large subunit ribosomal protein L6